MRWGGVGGWVGGWVGGGRGGGGGGGAGPRPPPARAPPPRRRRPRQMRMPFSFCLLSLSSPWAIPQNSSVCTPTRAHSHRRSLPSHPPHTRRSHPPLPPPPPPRAATRSPPDTLRAAAPPAPPAWERTHSQLKHARPWATPVTARPLQSTCTMKTRPRKNSSRKYHRRDQKGGAPGRRGTPQTASSHTVPATPAAAGAVCHTPPARLTPP